ncbi:ABC transporter ATP-binding protein [Aureimonas ureilytica]|uniref:ABC transporter ATP-binding protein n=1 Tax=Aureimonas ureilytica TaxID=401562 RepID=A0A175R2Z1_9HYPH|nr:ABC transporter ATP-binding protein [Aureimonas ureilytica]KTQ85298.1 ABC transporter ATP-binding protein [Aureimonas ureilytica]
MSELLRVEGLEAGYGEARVLAGLSFKMEAGEVLALLGRNGTGKTTLINTLVGVTTRHSGRIHLSGQDVTRRPPEARVALGLGWVPQERNIFRSLTVEENLTAVARPGPWNLDRIYSMFPRLRERRNNLGNQLSGGEQQMLAVGRALAVNPSLLLLDEPLEGLAPVVAEELLNAVSRIVREDGLSAIIVEQKARRILKLADQALVLDRGLIVERGTSTAFLADTSRFERHLGVGR